MRLLVKLLLLPVSISLSVIVALCRFVCDFSGALLAVVSFGLFMLAVASLLLLRDSRAALTSGIMAFLISPYGIPLLAEWFIDRLDDLCGAIKSI